MKNEWAGNKKLLDYNFKKYFFHINRGNIFLAKPDFNASRK